MDKLTKSRIAIVIMVIGTMMAASTAVSNANAAPTTHISGAGEIDYSCANGVVTNRDLPFQFSAQKGKDQDFKLSGAFEIVGKPGKITGDIYDGKVGKTSFSLLAIEQNEILPFCADHPGPAAEPVPSKGIITGDCGQGVQVDVKFENGGHGTGTANVVCFG